MGADEYSTTDFYTTAVLMAHGHELLRTEEEKKKVKRFVFPKTPALQALILDWVNGTLEGNLRGFRNAIDNVKDMIYSG